MSKILIIAEHDGETLNQATAKVVSCAAAIGGDIDIAVFGHGIDGVAAEAAAIGDVGRVLAVDAEHLAAPLAANWAPEAVTAADGYSHVLGPSTTFGKDLMPRIAALLGVNQVSDIMAVDGAYAFKRPIYAGNAIIEVTAPADEVMVGTVRVASWRSAGDGGSAAVEAGGDAHAAAARVPGDHGRAGPVPEEHAGPAILPVDHRGKAFHTDHQRLAVTRRPDHRRGHFQPVNETAATGIQVEHGRV